MKTKILKVNCDWEDIKNDCRTSMGKDDTDGVPSDKFKLDLLIAEHSPITQLWIKFAWEGIKSWISVHFTRHWLGWWKVVTSQRDDRADNEIPRDKKPQDTPVDMKINADAQALINVSKVRLCRQASDETREYMEDAKATIKDVEPEISFCMTPSCIYRAGCSEIKCCGYWQMFVLWTKAHNVPTDDLLDIRKRYALYNEYFYEGRKDNE